MASWEATAYNYPAYNASTISSAAVVVNDLGNVQRENVANVKLKASGKRFCDTKQD